jgi:very-short-patch-repair endonuclease
MHLRNRRFGGYKFRRQYSIDNYVVDFYCPELKLAIEVDGEIHEIKQQREYDGERQKYLEKFNIIFLRITNEEVSGNIQSVLLKIKDLIRNLEYIKN